MAWLGTRGQRPTLPTYYYLGAMKDEGEMDMRTIA